MKKIYLTSAVLLSLCMAQAQFTYDYLKAADTYYKKADYNSAAEYYEKYLAVARPAMKKESGFNPYTAQTGVTTKKVAVSSRQQAIFYLAESYRRLNFPSRAVDYYRQVLDDNEAAFPLAGYHYATALRALEKYEEAEKAFTHFLDTYKTDDAYSEAARKEILSLRFVQEQLKKKDLKLYTLTKADAPLNSKGANYAPAWLGENTLLFTSTRPDSTGDKKQVYTNRLYQAPYADGVVGNISRTGLPQAGNEHQGVVSAMPDGNTLFLTRWTIAQGVKKSAIYTSQRNGSDWSPPVLLDSLINVPGFNTQQPYVMEGGKYLLYASDRPGGRGGFDLWYAELDATGKPVRTANLGETINTAHDEQAPYYHAASGTLVFSGNGRIGMGGYDFYYSKGNVESFSAPVNFGYPVNSVKDDIYFVSRGSARNILEEVFLSSDRAAACCLELFSLRKLKPLKQVNGLVVTCGNNAPLAGAVIRIVDTVNNKTIYSRTTGPDGSYSLSLEEFQPLKVVATLNGYDTGALHFNAPLLEESDSLVNPALCLIREAPPVEAVIVIENVYYDFDKSALKAESYPALDKVVAMLNDHPDMVIEIGAHTDDKGSDAYNGKLSEARAQSVVNYLIGKGIGKDRLVAKGYGATMPVAPNRFEDGKDNPEGRQQNRRTEFKVLKN